MKRFVILFILILPMLCATGFADVPFSRNDDKGQRATSFSNGLATGNVPDTSVSSPAHYAGIPTTPLVTVLLDAPEAADADQFFSAMVGTTAGTFYPDESRVNATNASTGRPFCRNVTITPSTTTTGALTITYKDAQGRTLTSPAISFADTSSAVATAWTCREIVSVKVTVAFTTGTLNIGCADIFGLPYPAYAKTGVFYDSSGNILAFVDAGGDDFPATSDVVTMVAGLPDTDASDDFGTVDFTDAPDGTVDFYFVYVATHWWDDDKAYPITSWSLQ